MTKNCLNCGHSTDNTYCSYCGQKTDTGRLNTHFLWHEVQHAVIHLDKGILFTIKELFTRPGHSIREFIEGKRVRHFRPLMFLFVLAGIYGYLNHTLHLVEPQLSTNTISAKAVQWVITHYSFTELMILPFFSLATWLAFRKWGFNYFEHIALNAFLGGQRIVIHLLLVPVFYTCKNSLLLTLLKISSEAIMLVISCVTYVQFFKGHSGFHTLARLLLAFLYMVLIVLLVSVMIGIYWGVMGKQ